MASRELERILSNTPKDLSALEGNLLSAAKGKEPRVICVTSCRPREGKTTVAVSMAHALAARAGGEVLLVDGNARAPRLHELFDQKDSPGLTDLVAGQGADGAIRSSGIDRLQLLPAGARNETNKAAFTVDRFAQTVDALRKRFTYVIFDGTSVLTSSDMSMVARCFDGIIFVAECEKTKRDMLGEARDNIQNAGGKVLGVILNKRRHYIPRGLYGKV